MTQVATSAENPGRRASSCLTLLLSRALRAQNLNACSDSPRARASADSSPAVKVTAQEEAALKLRAQERGITIPRLMLESALAPQGEGASERREALVELFRVRRQLAGVATNVNQIAHAVNTDGRLPIGSAATLARIEEIVGKLDAAIDGLAIA